MEIVDTHCHIHEILSGDRAMAEVPVHDKWHKAGKTDPDVVIADAAAAGVTRLVCVGTTVEDSELAVAFVQDRDSCWATIGIHPHEAARYRTDHAALKRFEALAARSKVVGVGECGLDYYYGHSPKEDQIAMLRYQIELALRYDLPMTFHVRDAFDDFWQVFDEYQGIRGVVHSFTADKHVLAQALERGLYIALNGIMTFTKDAGQLEAARLVPLDRLVVETDAPYLTPKPYRGNICEPRHAATTLSFVANLYQTDSVTEAEVALATTANARRLFNLA